MDQHPMEICSVPRTPMPLSKQQKIREFWRKIERDIGERALPVSRIRKIIRAQKGTMMMACDTPSFVTKACEIFVQELAFRAWMCAESHQRRVILDTDIAEAISSTEWYGFLNDILHAYYEEVHNSVPRTKPTKKKKHHRYLNQPSSSYPPPPPYVQAPVSVSQNNVHPSPLAFQFPLQDVCSLMETCAIPTPNLTGTIPPSNFDSCNDIFASSAMNLPLQVYSGPMPEIPNTCFENMVTNASTAPYGVVDASIHNVATQKEGVVIQSNPILPRVVDTGSLIPTCGGIDLDTAIRVEEGQQHQQEEEETMCDLLVDGNLEGIVVGVDTNSSGGISSINFNEFDNESWLSGFWSDFMIEEDPAPWLDPASSTNVPQNLGGSPRN